MSSPSQEPSTSQAALVNQETKPSTSQDEKASQESVPSFSEVRQVIPSTSVSPLRNQGIKVENLRLPLSPLAFGSSRKKEGSVFSKASPRLSSDEIEESIREEIPKLRLKFALNFSELTKDSLFSYSNVMHFTHVIMFKRNTYLQSKFSKILHAKLSEHYESLAKDKGVHLQKQFEDSDDPNYKI